MADISVSQLTPIVKNTDDIRFLSIGSLPAVLSTEVARNFQRNHAHVLREIDRLRSILPKSFVESNFGFVFRIVPTGNGGTRKACGAPASPFPARAHECERPAAGRKRAVLPGGIPGAICGTVKFFLPGTTSPSRLRRATSPGREGLRSSHEPKAPLSGALSAAG